MKRLSIATIAFFAAVGGHPVKAASPTDFAGIDAQLAACSARNPSNPGVSNCTAIATAAADRRLNAVYAAALHTLNQPGAFDPVIAKRLVVAERAWIAFRDAECDYKSMIALGGSGLGYAYVACRYEQTKARVRALMAPDEPHIAR